MVETKDIEKLAKRLRNAYANRTACAPLRHLIGTEDIATAYAIQELNNKQLIAKGARVVLSLIHI